MDMQDKEFDQLFNSKLGNLEVAPSPIVWDNIAAEMDDKKTKPTIMPWLSIAATVLVVLGAGLFFLQKGNSNTYQPKQTKPIANKVETPATMKPQQSKPVEETINKQPDNVASVVKHQHNLVGPGNNPM